MDERVKFIARLLNGGTMSGLCEEFGVSAIRFQPVESTDGHHCTYPLPSSALGPATERAWRPPAGPRCAGKPAT